MFKEYKNFFSLEKCNSLIDIFNEKVKHHVAYTDNTNPEAIPTANLRLKEGSPKLIKTLKKDFNITLNYGYIIHWSNGSFMKRHYDGVLNPANKDNDFTSICYLNDNFKGGRTLLGDERIEPEMGKVIVFNSKKIEHGVEEVIGDRFTYASWWKKQPDA